MSSSNNPLCSTGCGEIGTLHCAGCLVAFYCGKVCQAKVWQQHKGPCKEAAKARKAVDEMEAKQTLEAAASTSSPSATLCATGCGEIATLRCPRCLGAFYCTIVCQRKAWPEHKGPCKAAAMLLDGKPIDQFDKDFEGYKRAAEAGNASAQYNLGLSYYKGTGIAVDKREAVKWFKLAAEAGYADAQFVLAYCYKQGDGVDADLSEAFKWYKRAAETGSINAQTVLGWCYQFGDGVAINMKEAVKWFTQAAKAGNATAQHNLGNCYLDGTGVAVDKREAVKWLTLSAKGGFKKAQDILDELI